MSLITTVVIAVVAGVLLFLIILRLAFFCTKRRRQRSAPLPPVQPLAHHREKMLAASYRERELDARTTSQFYPPHPGSSQPSFRTSLSGAPLLTQPSTGNPQFSGTFDSTTNASFVTEGAYPDSPVSLNTGDLPAPRIPWTQSSDLGMSSKNSSNVQLASDDSESSLPSVPGIIVPSESGSRPASTADSVNSRKLRRESGTPSEHSARTFQTTQTTRTAPSIRSTRTFSTLRGPPHRPHSRVEVVLPAPLAPEAYPHTEVPSGEFGFEDITETYTPAAFGDSWVTISSPVPIPRTAGRGRKTSNKSIYASGVIISAQYPASSSRASSLGPGSRPPLNPGPKPAAVFPQMYYEGSRASSLPPVPRVPSMYSNWTPQSSRYNSGVDFPVPEHAHSRVNSTGQPPHVPPGEALIEEGSS